MAIHTGLSLLLATQGSVVLFGSPRELRRAPFPFLKHYKMHAAMGLKPKALLLQGKRLTFELHTYFVTNCYLSCTKAFLPPEGRRRPKS